MSTWVPGCSPNGEREQALTAHTAVELRATLDRLLADPHVDTFRYISLRQWDSNDDPRQCQACGKPYIPVQMVDDDCACGGHRTWRCGTCPIVTLPPRTDICGPIHREQ